MKEAGKIVGFCVLASCVYGVLHDQVTARIYLPYFTVFHPDLGLPKNATAIAFGWGIVATWWVGVLLGVPLAFACRMGAKPKLTLHFMARPIGRLLLCMAVLASIAALLGYALGRWAPSIFSGLTPVSPADLPRFLAVAFAHQASYASGAVGGVALLVWAQIVRRSSRRAESQRLV